MALVLKDRVKETSVSTGTGAIALDGAVGPYQAFSIIGNGNQTYYAIVGQTSTEWEVGIGTYTLATDTISRDTILASSNSNTIVTFSAGTKDVFITYPSEKAIYEEPSGETLINAGPITVIGAGVTSIPSLPAELGKFIGDVDSFAQIYTLNQNDGSTASADIIAYNDLTTDGFTYFTDMGISSSNYTSLDYPIFTPNSGYIFHQGADFFIGNQTTNKDIKFFSGGVEVTDLVATFSGTDRSASFEADVNVGGAIDVTGAATFGSTVLLDANPTLALQAATKQYVDNAAATGFTVHTPARLATTAALAANTYNNGTLGVGATLTANANGALSIDGIAVATNDRVLIKNEAASANNGVYDVTATGSAGAPYVLTRSADFNQAAAGEIANNAYVFVTAGNTLIGSSFVLSQTATIVVGTTALPFTEFASAVVYTGGTNINITGQTISLTGTVAATNGGTGTSTVTTGDLLYGSASNTWSKLPVGSAYRSLVVNSSGTQVEWNAVALNQTGAVSGSLGATNGGTGQTGYTLGDTLYSSATDTLTKLAGNTSTTKQYLSQTGTGSASAAPSWATISAADIGAGTLPAVRGGTGQSSYTIGDILYADTTTSLAKLADVATGNVLISGGISAAPAWGKVALASAVSGTLGIANGGTSATTANGAFNALAPSQTSNSGKYLTTDGTDTSWATVTQTTFSAGTTGFTPSTATSGTVTLAGTLNIANGGTGETTRQAALDTLAGATTSGYYLRGNGTDVVMSAIVAGDVPTLNQNTTGYAADVAGGVSNQILYQTGINATGYITAPTTASTFLQWNGSIFTWAAAGGSSNSFERYEFIATASQTTFAVGVTLSVIQVFVSGVLQKPTTDYTISGTNVVLTSGVPVGTIVSVQVFSTFSVANTYTQAETTALINTAVPSQAGNSGKYLTTNGSNTSWGTITVPPAFPSGTRMPFQQTSAPTGWTKDTTAGLNDSIMRIVTGTATSGGSTAFSTFNDQTATGATTLTSAQSGVPAHSHSITDPTHSHTFSLRTTDVTSTPTVADGTGNAGTLGSQTTAGASTGITGTNNNTAANAASGHDHTITTSIKYYDFIIASKD